MYHPLKVNGTGNFCFQSHYRGSVQKGGFWLFAPADTVEGVVAALGQSGAILSL